jgi:alkyl sulfatase BDS1-like metallo-beta-lactamase superfamily hydrolase
MNGGARLDEIVHTVRAPAHLLEKPYLKPVYDEPEFVVRNIWRQFGGWWDGNPSSLKPAPDSVLAAELCDLAGGAAAVASRALALAADASSEVSPAGARTSDVPVSLRLAAQLAELASLAAGGDAAIERVRAEVFAACAQRATSTMAKGVFTWAVRESEARFETGA